jgi:hypothetical protein
VRHPRLAEVVSVFSKYVHRGCPFDIRGEGEWLELMLAAVRDLREVRAPASQEELEQFEVDVLAGFVLARASSGVTDTTIRGEVGHLEHVRTWFERAL